MPLIVTIIKGLSEIKESIAQNFLSFFKININRKMAESLASEVEVASSDVNQSMEELFSGYSVDTITKSPGWLDWLPSWKPTSQELLIQSERDVLSCVFGPYTDLFVPINEECSIRTITMAPDVPSLSPPLVMVHGFGCGLGAFYKNFDSLHSDRRLFAFDVLGFGRSSRAKFGTDPETVEEEFVNSFEKWREALGLEKMVLLGHSLGAFMSCAYAMRHPDKIQHLILVEPWGFIRKPEVETSSFANSRKYKVAKAFTGSFNMFAPIRIAGPIGPRLITKVRPDLEAKFGEDFMKYVYHCNAQEPAGETAFWYLTLPIAWARRPMIERLDSLSPTVPISCIYGTRSWFDNSTGEKVFAMRPSSYVDIHFVKGAGHHIHADTPEMFNEIVQYICRLTDEGKDVVGEGERRTEQEAYHTH